jgi:hypothetical protein
MGVATPAPPATTTIQKELAHPLKGAPPAPLFRLYTGAPSPAVELQWLVMQALTAGTSGAGQ